MPPTVKISKEDIVNTAVAIVQEHGDQAINARTIAAMLNCSTQPIFSNFSTMEALKLAVVDRADALYQEYITREIASNDYPPYKASGMAYIRFAKEEKELFKLLYMRDRSKENISQNMELNEQMEGIIQNSTGLDGTQMKLFHLKMWAYVHGIATMFATDFLDLDWDLVSQMLTDAYQAFKKQYERE